MPVTTILLMMITMIRNKLIIALSLLFFSFSAVAQFNDFQTWTSVGLKTDISKKFSAGLGVQLRMTNNSTLPGSVIMDPDLTFKINKYLRIGAAYRFTFKMGNDKENTTRHRYNIDLEGRKKFDKLTLKLRAGFQKGFTDLVYNENREPYSYPAYNRNKLSIDYQVNKIWNPYAEFELFLPLNDPRQRNLDRYRLTLGSSFDLKNRNELNGYFRIQKELNTANPETDFIIGIGYAYDLKIKKKKDKDTKKDKKDKKEGKNNKNN